MGTNRILSKSVAFLFFLPLLFLLSLSTAKAGEPPQKPFIFINTEMHAGRMTGAATDSEGAILATVSADKKLKLWRLKTGELIRSILPPVGEGTEGQLNCVALSPDGRTVAAGGSTGGTWDGSFSVYLFDVRNGEMVSRITGFKGWITSLAYSRDGKRIAVGTAAGRGIAVHFSQDGRRLFADGGFSGNALTVEFDGQGNLLATSDQGDVKRYDPEGAVAYALRLQEATKIHSAALSPDGSRFALGFEDKGAVEIRDAVTGSISLELDDSQRRKGAYSPFRTVAWSADGSRLFAAGNRTAADGHKMLCAWTVRWNRLDGRVNLPVKATISKLLSLKNSLLFVAAVEGLGLLGGDGGGIYYHPLEHPDFLKNNDVFGINRDASLVRFSYERYGHAKASFDLKTRRLAVGDVESAEVLRPNLTAEGVNVSNWQDGGKPRLGRHNLKGLSASERCWSLAVRRDGQGFVIGTTHALRAYDRTGKQRWVRRVSSIPWSLAFSADDGTFTASQDDGTIRWYRADTGEEKYALYLHPDRKRWLFWLPSGYFDHGPDSAGLVGFLVNQGKEREAAFVRLDQMYDLFYRPDVIERATAGEDISRYIDVLRSRTTEKTTPEKATAEKATAEKAAVEKATAEKAAEERVAAKKAAAVKAAAEKVAAEKATAVKAAAEKVAAENAAGDSETPQQPDEDGETEDVAEDSTVVPTVLKPPAPPVVESIVNTATLPPRVRLLTQSGTARQRDIKLEAELCDNGGGIGNVTLFLNDVPILFGQSGRGVAIRPASATKGCYRFEPTITLTPDRNIVSLTAYNRSNTIESRPERIELVLPSEPEKPRLHILTVAIDRYRDGDLRLKYPVSDATELEKKVIERAKPLFSEILTYRLYNEEVTREKIREIFSRSGGNTRREDVFLLFLAGHGVTDEREGKYYFLPADFRYTGEESVAQQGISVEEFKRYLTKIQAMKSVILLDTCNSGSFAEAIGSRGITEKVALGKLARAVGRATIAASSKNQVALEGYQGHGVFTYTVLEGMNGKAANARGDITVNRLATFIEETLPELTYKRWGYEQIPQKSLQGMDFPLGVR